MAMETSSFRPRLAGTVRGREAMRFVCRRHVAAKGFLYLRYRAATLLERGGHIGGGLDHSVTPGPSGIQPGFVGASGNAAFLLCACWRVGPQAPGCRWLGAGGTRNILPSARGRRMPSMECRFFT